MARSIYRLTQPADVEGRSSHTIGYFTHKRDAEAVGKTGLGNRAMGPSDGTVRHEVVYDSIRDFVDDSMCEDERVLALLTDAERQEHLKQMALSKLSLAERQALGV